MNKYKLIPCLTVLVLLIMNSHVHAQDSDSIRFYSTNKATMIGVGSANLYDTYLSPLKYRGTSWQLLDERMKRTSWFNHKFTRQQTININVCTTDNPAGNAREYAIMGLYMIGGHYNLYNDEKFRISVGGLLNLTGGVIYNERNSNNPASAKLNSNINLSLIGFYHWKKITFRGQFDTPVAGILFSPHYGQSYYEISLGNSVGVVNFASLHNQRALRSYFTADIPISKISLRIGYLGSFYQTKVHNITSHIYSNSFIIGLVSESINISGNKIKTTKIIDSSYY